MKTAAFLTLCLLVALQISWSSAKPSFRRHSRQVVFRDDNQPDPDNTQDGGANVDIDDRFNWQQWRRPGSSPNQRPRPRPNQNNFPGNNGNNWQGGNNWQNGNANQFPGNNGNNGNQFPGNNGNNGNQFPGNNGNNGNQFPGNNGNSGNQFPDNNGNNGNGVPDNGQGEQPTPVPVVDGAPTATTPAPTPRPECLLSCPVTPEYNPVCGSNRQTYTNMSRLECARRCGLTSIQMARSGPCPRSR